LSLCYDFQKWTIISLALVAVSLTIGLVSLAYGQEVNQTRVESDFYLEGKINESPDGIHNINITKFEIQGNSSSYKEICPSLQCKIDYKDSYPSFNPPDIPENKFIVTEIDFTIQDGSEDSLDLCY
jgi:hypothetical protein